MSDDTTHPESPESPTEAAPKREIANPMLAWVRGGTRTSASLAEDEKRFQASEHARDVADREKELAAIPVEQGGAVMHHKDLRGPQGATYAYCRYYDRYNNAYTDGIVDIGMDSNAIAYLMVVCPRCVRDRGMHADQSQLKISRLNKKFELQPQEPAKFKVFDDGLGQKRYRIGIKVQASEKFKCGRCDWVARFENGDIRED